MGWIEKLIALRQKGRVNLSQSTIESTFKVNLQDVYDLHELVESWKDVYIGIPDWVGDGKNCVKDSLNVASMIIGDIATKCVSELSLDSRSKSLRDFFENEIKQQIREQLEFTLAMGAVCVRPFVDENNRVRLAWYSADRFIPLQWEGKKCVGGLFFEQAEKHENNQVRYYTKLEYHQWLYSGVKVSVKLFESNSPDVIGKEVPLSTIPQWADLGTELVLPDSKSPLFCYIKTPFANNKALGNKAGVSIFKDAIGVIEAVDRTWDNLKWEMESAVARIFVEQDAIPMHMTRSGERVMDLNAKDFKMFSVLDAHEGRGLIDVYSPQIRQAEITAMLKTHLSLLCSSMHLDSGAYVYDDSKQMVTATEISTKEQKTYQTITDIQKWTIEPSIKSIVEAVNEVAKAYGLEQFSTENFTISFGDSILHDEQSMKITAQQEVQYGLRSVKSYLMEYRHLSEAEADAEIKMLREEKSWQSVVENQNQNQSQSQSASDDKVRDSKNPEHVVEDEKSSMKTRDSK